MHVEMQEAMLAEKLTQGQPMHPDEPEYAEPFQHQSFASESERNARLVAMEMAATMVHNTAPISQPAISRELVSYDDL